MERLSGYMGQQPIRTGWWDTPPAEPSGGELSLVGGGVGARSAVYSSPEALARHANTWVGLARLVFAVAEDDVENIRLIRSNSIDEDTMRQRRAVIWTAKLHTTAGLTEIGRLLNRDHSSVCRSLEEAEKLYVEDPSFRALCKRINARAKNRQGGKHA